MEGLAIENIGIFYGNMVYLVYFVAVCHILLLLGIYFPVLACCTTKNLATLAQNVRNS
jgi:hypothetical protein